MNGPETRESLLASLNSPVADEGWREFAAIYRPLIFRVAVAKGLQHADAEDLSQEVEEKGSQAILLVSVAF
jgi:RNA polymerase sigma-70 factor (ECF subfamily)